jgi:hypothetical protein
LAPTAVKEAATAGNLPIPRKASDVVSSGNFQHVSTEIFKAAGTIPGAYKSMKYNSWGTQAELQHPIFNFARSFRTRTSI